MLSYKSSNDFMQAFSILRNEKHPCVIWSRDANTFESVAMYS